ncbi:hypothetical protein ACFQZC_00930 [Streptacidiphilus monticola]
MANSSAATSEASGDATVTDSAPPTYQSNNGSSTSGYNPAVVNGVDYSAVTPDRSLPCNTQHLTLKTGIFYSTVGEAHAYYDTTAAFNYSAKLSSTITVAYSTDGTTWKFSGSVAETGAIGYSTGFSSQGPMWAKQWRVPIRYAYIEDKYYCAGILESHSYRIQPMRYEVPSGGAVGLYGSDVRYKDGQQAYANSPTGNRGYIPKRAYFQLDYGHSAAIGRGVSAWGVSLTMTTTYDSNHYEKITAGNGQYEHDIWGQNGPLSSNPGVILSW